VIIAVISDIHANAEALAASLSDMSAVGAEKVIVLGDIVGYGADPEACAQALIVMAGDEPLPDAMTPELLTAVAPFRDTLICAVMGNHDLAAFSNDILTWMRYEAVEAVLWQRKMLSAEALSFLIARPFEVGYGDAVLVHSTPHRPEIFGYISSQYEASDALANVKGRLFFVGHTHDPIVYSEEQAFSPLIGEPIALDPEARYIVNAGSVGQPRDRDPRSSYLLWDMDADTVEFRRVEYDVETAAKKIYKAGLPIVLGDRLLLGM
jgi:diadenosine tetraphosphatase ApaH/serine/threonine PP2A family protein phosphatase